MNIYNCPKCNQEFSAGSNYCKNCGYNLSIEFIENPTCPKCNKSFPAGSKFCDIDGIKLISQDKLAAYHRYTEASFGNRFLAFFLDGLIVTALSIPAIVAYAAGLVNIVNKQSENTTALFVIAAILYIIPLTYTLIKDGLGRGQSWGKRAVGLMVMHLPDNRPCTLGQSSLRNLFILFFGLIPILGWLAEPIMVLVSENGRRMGDRAANTMVVELNHLRYVK